MKVPEFAIAQNDKTRRTMLWSIDHWKELPDEDYEIVALILSSDGSSTSTLSPIETISWSEASI